MLVRRQKVVKTKLFVVVMNILTWKEVFDVYNHTGLYGSLGEEQVIHNFSIATITSVNIWEHFMMVI